METIEGVVYEIIYTNEENGYTICELECGEECITVCGTLPFIHIGDRLTVSGGWVTHLEYGEQFKAASFEKCVPKESEAILLYLSSGAIKGVREATAKRIVDRFGEDSLDIIQNSPEMLSSVKGISNKLALSIHNQYLNQINIQKIISYFKGFDVSVTLAYKIYKHFGETTIETISENPYAMCDIDGIGFKTADKMAESMGVARDNPKRADAALVYILSESLSGGHTYLPADVLTEYGVNMLGTDENFISAHIAGLLVSGRLKKRTFGETDAIYLPAYYTAEMGCAYMLPELADAVIKDNIKNIDKKITQFEENNFPLAEKQQQAVKYAAENALTVITGGPGTGKTTIINTIISLMKSEKKTVTLCAPTGRAAKRMSETCNMEAKTIHRLLEMEYSIDSSKLVFKRTSTNPIETDVLIVDEASMIDILLFYNLLKAVPHGCRLILVGDCDQLPSVGAGNVLHDIIDSERFGVIRLTEIFRQAKESMIVVNAHNINSGIYPECNDKSGDFFFIRRQVPKDGIAEILQLAEKRLPKFLGVDSLSGIQVITPTKRGEMGAINLNSHLQNVFNPPSHDKKEIKRGQLTIRSGDKVMQVKNNYDIEWTTTQGIIGSGIFNGDMGIVEHIDTKSGIIDILFDGEKKVEYPIELIDDIELAYAITVHKSQGSEFTAVIMPVFPAHKNLMSRNLFYTAVTRAKRLVVLVGREDIIQFMTDNNYQAQRYSGLKNLLSGENNVI